MSRFTFRLKRVLGVRRVEADLARAEWQEAEGTARTLEAEARDLQQAVDRAREALAALQSSPQLSAADVLLKQAFVDRLREQSVQRTIHASRARRESERLRLALSERRVRVRGLETLESRARQAWQRETEAGANAELDARAELLGAKEITRTTEDRHASGAWSPS